MMHRLRSFYCILCCLLCAPSLAHAQSFISSARPMPIEEGFAYFRIEGAYFSAANEFAGDGGRRGLYSFYDVSDAVYSDYRLNFHYEYGFLKQLSFVAKLGFRRIQADYTNNVRPSAPSVDRKRTVVASGFDDLWLYGRYGLIMPDALTTPLAVSVQAGIKIPTGDLNTPIPIGTGVIDYEARVLAGYTFEISGAPSYLNGELGYRLRGGDYQSQQPFRVEFGYRAARELTLRTSLSGLASSGAFRNPVGITERPNNETEFNITAVGDEGYTQLSAGFEFAFSPAVALSFDYVTAIAGRTTNAGDTFFVAFSFK